MKKNNECRHAPGCKLRDEGKSSGSLTFSSMLLAAALIFLISTVSLYIQAMGAATSEAAGLENIAAQSGAASYSLSSILRAEAVNISSSGTNITFSLDSANLWRYRLDAARFKLFAEAYSSPGNFTLNAGNSSEAARPLLYIRPQNITADFTEGSMNFTPASNGQVAGYVSAFKISSANPSINWTSISEVANTSSDALYFRLGVEGKGKADSDTRWLNRSSTSTLEVKNNKGELQFRMALGPQSQLLISYFVSLTATATLMLNSSASADYTELGANIINVRLDDGTNATLPVIVHAG